MMPFKKKSIQKSGLLLLSSCIFSISLSCKTAQKKITPTEGLANTNPLSEQLVVSTLWFQNSLEARQLFSQSYNLAKIRLEENLQKKKIKAPAVILDIDETVLDNSAYEARLIKNSENYSPASWEKWVQEENAPALPGALNFVQFARQKGVAVFFVSNRNEEDSLPTLRNLNKQGFATSPDKLFLKKETSNKDARRAEIGQNYQVVLFIGDQLTDFSNDFESASAFKSFPSAKKDSLQKELRTHFILLPNPMYGSFEQDVYTEKGMSELQKNKARKAALRTK